MRSLYSRLPVKLQAALHQQIAERANRLFPPPKPPQKRRRVAFTAPMVFFADENGEVQTIGGESFYTKD